MIIKYVLILGIGHLLGDFYFQNEKIAKYKNEKYRGVLWHSLEYYIAVLVTILPVLSWDMVFAATYSSLAHFIIDTVKYVSLIKQKIRKSSNVFLIDQSVHVISIFILTFAMDCWNFTIGRVGIVNSILKAYDCDAEIFARWILAILLIHKPVNIFIQNFLGDYKQTSDEMIIKRDNKICCYWIYTHCKVNCQVR